MCASKNNVGVERILDSTLKIDALVTNNHNLIKYVYVVLHVLYAYLSFILAYTYVFVVC